MHLGRVGEPRRDVHRPAALAVVPILEARHADILVAIQRGTQRCGNRRHPLGVNALGHGHGLGAGRREEDQKRWQDEKCQSAWHGMKLRMRLFVEFLMKHINDPFSPVVGVADQALAFEIDHEIEQFQRKEPNQDRASIRDFGNLDDAFAALNGELDWAIDAERRHAGGGSRLGGSELRQSKIFDLLLG